MKKIHKINKYMYSFIFSVISILVFILDINIPIDYKLLYTTSPFEVFFIDLYYSLKEFDILYLTIWLILLYYYTKTYFNKEKNNKKIILIIAISIILSLLTTLFKFYRVDNTLTFLFKTNAQIFKTIINITGHYLIYYSLIKGIINIKKEKNV